jgi:parvulin-like peptidyl-prolyl isomerase
MLRTSFVFLLVIFALATTISAQPKESIVAEIGNQRITDKDFRLRFELSPYLSRKSNWNIDTLKSDFLYSLVSERLWFLEAMDKMMDRTDKFQFYFKPIEDIFLRDALFKKEISDKILLSATDVSKAIYNSQYTSKTTVIYSPDSALIIKLDGILGKSKTVKLDSLLKTKEFTSCSANPIEIKLGTLKDEEIENSIFLLRPGGFTKPIKSEVGWVIFFVNDLVFKAIDLGDEKATNEAKKIVKERRAFIKTNEFLQNYLRNFTLNIDEPAFKLVADKIYKTIVRNTAKFDDTSTISYSLNEIDYTLIKSELGKENLNKTLFSVKDKKVTIWDFLANLAFEEHAFTSKKKEGVYQRLSKLAKNFVQQNILTFEAENQGLFNAKSVRDDLESWKQNMMAQMLKVSLLDSVRVSDQEIQDYYRKSVLTDKDFVMVNLKLITLPNLAGIEDALNLTGKGKTFDEIVASYGKTDSLVNEKGETGLKPAIFLGDIGIIASKLSVNELYGPIKRGDNYTLLMVKEKQQVNDSLKINFENSKEQLRSYLFQKKLNQFISKKTLQLADKYQAKVYENVLKDIKTTNITMFVHRLMGFGGRISGVPLLDNWVDWIDINKLRQELLP